MKPLNQLYVKDLWRGPGLWLVFVSTKSYVLMFLVEVGHSYDGCSGSRSETINRHHSSLAACKDSQYFFCDAEAFNPGGFVIQQYFYRVVETLSTSAPICIKDA